MIKLKGLIKEGQLTEVMFDTYLEGVLKTLEKLDKHVYQTVVSMYNKTSKFKDYITKAFNAHNNPHQTAQGLMNLVRPSRYGMAEAGANDKDQIIQQLIKWGNNKQDAIKMVNSNYDYINRVYPNATISKKAEIIKTIH